MNKLSEKRICSLLNKNPNKGLSLAMDIYGGAVKTICKNILYDCKKEDIEEAISDTFFKLWKNIDKYRFDKNTPLKSYIYAIARNTALDKRRKLKGNSIVLPIEENNLGITVSMEDEYVQKINNKVISKTIYNMEEPDKSIFILRYFYYERIKDIAERLNVSSKKVENSLYRGKEKLKKSLTEGGIIHE